MPLTLTVGGLPGTGSSTLCRLLESALDLPYVYAGQMFRQQALERGVSLEAFNELAAQDPEVDRALDARQLDYLRRGGVILEGRLSGWLADRERIEAFKVWVVCREDERIRRLVTRDGGDAATHSRKAADRVHRETDRYRRYYGADLEDLSIYDLVMDSTDRSPNDLCSTVVAELDARGLRGG